MQKIIVVSLGLGTEVISILVTYSDSTKLQSLLYYNMHRQLLCDIMSCPYLFYGFSMYTLAFNKSMMVKFYLL